MSAPLLRAQGVAWSPPGKPPVLAGVDLDLWPGQVVWLSGPSGSGKSTLLRILNRLLTPEAGEILVGGRPAEGLAVPLLRRRVALVGQQPVMVAEAVREELVASFAFKAAGGAAPPDDSRLAELMAGLALHGVGLTDGTAGLSVGQKQRVCLLRSLLMKPEVLLLDEPVSGLDAEARSLVEQAAGRFAQAGGAVLMASHLPPTVGDAPLRQVAIQAGRLNEVVP